MTFTTFKRLYKDYQESGLNIKDFCTNQDLAPSTFYYWRNKLEEALAYEPDSFVPLEFDSNPLATNNQSSPSIIKSKPTLNNDAPIEFLFPNGTKMLLRDNINTQVLKTIVLKSDYIQVDESTIPVISNEKHKRLICGWFDQ